MEQGGDKAQDIAAHYELICADWRAGKEVYLAARFDKHGQAGLDFLLAQLSGGGDEKIRVLIAALAAEVLSKLRHLDFYAPYCDRLVGPLCALLVTGDVQLRRKVVIALGWVGGQVRLTFWLRCFLTTTTHCAGLGARLVSCKCPSIAFKGRSLG